MSFLSWSRIRSLTRAFKWPLLLQEHKYDLVGNAAVMINGYNQFGNTEEVLNMVSNNLFAYLQKPLVQAD